MGNFKLKEHQLQTVEFGLKSPYSIFALAAGLGKTAVALEIFERTQSQTMLVVCPAYLVLNWVMEIHKYFGDKYLVTAVKVGKDIPKEMPKGITILSYEFATRSPHLFEKADSVICDEAHHLKSMNAKRTNKIHQFVFENNCKRVHLMTGTPIKNRVEEFYSLLAICHYRPDLEENSDFLTRFPDSTTFADYFSFRFEHEFNVGYRRVKIVKWEGVKNKDELKKYLKPVYIKMRAEDILDLPPVVYMDHYISTDPDEFLLMAYEKHEDASSSVMSEYKAMAALKKAPFTAEYAKGLLESGVDHLLIYTDHVDACELLAQKLKAPFVHGGVPMDTRQKYAERFQLGQIPVLVATIGSFSTGVTLTKAADLIFNDASWTPGDNSQVIGRIVRVGQTKQCRVHRMMGSPQDAAIYKSLAQKTETIEKAT